MAAANVAIDVGAGARLRSEAEVEALMDCEQIPLAARSAALPRPAMSRRGRVVSIAVSAGLMCALLTLHIRGHSLARADTGATQTKFIGAAISALAEALIGGASLAREFSHDYADIEKLMGERGFSDELTEFSRRIGKKVKEHELEYDNETWKKFVNTTNIEQIRLMLKPHINRHDGNRCEDDEEMHAGLCYKRCDLLTEDELEGPYPIRVSAFSCCRKAPCLWADLKFKFSICGGFDVSGDASGNRCPHAPGACFEDEELHYGLCYKQCAILTEGKYMWRTGPSTCCVFRSSLGCGGTGPGGPYAITDPKFTKGGGTCEPGSPCLVHPPIQRLTEDPSDQEDQDEYERIEDERKKELEKAKKAAEAAAVAAANATDKDVDTCKEELGSKYGYSMGKLACEAAQAASRAKVDSKEDERRAQVVEKAPEPKVEVLAAEESEVSELAEKIAKDLQEISAAAADARAITK